MNAPADKLAALATAMRHFIAKPDTNGPEWLTFLEAIDAVDNTAIAEDRIDDMRADLDDEPEYRFVRTSGEGFDGDWVEVRSAYGLSGSIGVWA